MLCYHKIIKATVIMSQKITTVKRIKDDKSNKCFQIQAIYY